MGSPGCDRVGSTVPLPLMSFNDYPYSVSALRAWEEEDTKPPRGLISVPKHTASERSLQGVFLPCSDMLLTEDSLWLLKKKEAAPPEPPCKHLEQCPVIDSQGMGVGLGLEVPSGLEGQVEERCLEQVQSIVLGEVMKDIETACKLLNITPEPMEWNCGNVQKWLLWTEHLYRLPQVGKVFQELSGKDLCSMTEEDFRQRSMQCGDLLFAHLDIWRSAACMKECCTPGDTKLHGAEETCPEADSSCSSQPIHLWQFLRQLLLKPHNYGRCIRWLNKEKGIFKIENSAHVARLWGLRKNRPAMNYDKLSRSIRQYYKKGIIRKPDVSQRLVYQFVHPV
ncbi:SAM pointed domain-containing Ets transcription factor-like [Salvelinus alpinus]|uniref:SAM pointed domain-containing Ets transcription factor-like n=1 Tax=Salvelinus sp. IW2-2015 TaxID=2691554 RepID=UPI000CDF9DD0|nr:SAM pointed domain-containing Ets transcription factor-like [Salvelinus alpinus]